MTDNNKNDTCTHCNGTGNMTQWGIARIYLFPSPVSVLLVVLGLVLGVLKNVYWFFLSGLGYMLPLIAADMRLSLYPIVFIGALMGKKVNCPKCNPNGPIFKDEF